MLTGISAVLLAVSIHSQRLPAREPRTSVVVEQVNNRPAIKLSEMPPALADLSATVRGPEQIDAATGRLGIPPRLLNFNLATPVDMSDVGLGKAVHIPVQISSREGGRKSIFYLESGEEALAGIFVTDDGLALRHVRRLSGKGLPAQTGDMYETKVTTVKGEDVYRVKSRLEILDAEHGKGRLVPVEGSGAATKVKEYCLLASFVIFRSDDSK
jgi:hypothetical protein